MQQGVSSCRLIVAIFIVAAAKSAWSRTLRRAEKECQGSASGFNGLNSDILGRYRSYVQHYTGCTTVLLNLEIVGLSLLPGRENETYDMSFLESIEEVHGYVLLAQNHVDVFPLKNLRVIHGRTQYLVSRQDYYKTYSLSLSVLWNFKNESETVGLKEIHLNSLHEIVEGSVLFWGNNLLCFQNTIAWNDILTSPTATYDTELEPNAFHNNCSEQCDQSCLYNGTGSRHCWGAGPENCQKIHRLSCSPNCAGRCYGPEANQCCSQQCVGGCLDSFENCWGCKDLKDGGKCVENCPLPTIYNTKKFDFEPNPNVKYSNGRECVEKCPGNMMIKSGACVKGCGQNQKADGNRTCQPCVPETCPKICEGGAFNANTSSNYTDCTIIQGHLSIDGTAFQSNHDIPPLTKEHLSILKSVREIRDYLFVQGVPAEMNSLSFLRNLTTISGQSVHLKSGASLVVTHSNIKSLDLTSLQTVQGGRIVIMNNPFLEELNLVSFKSYSQNVTIKKNPALCYVNSVSDWKAFPQAVNLNKDLCDAMNRTCSSLCRDGCWGAGDSQCVACNGVKFGHTCMTSCSATPGLYEEPSDTNDKLCKQCDPQCLDNCTGLGPSKCLECLHVKDGPHCVASCPSVKYASASNTCELCHIHCKDGCTGPGDHQGPGGCNACHLYHESHSESNYTCIKEDSVCVRGFYSSNFFVQLQNATKPVLGCKKCHKECASCSNGSAVCDRCVNVKEVDQCVANCSSKYYYDRINQVCSPCDKSCKRCIGPTKNDCVACDLYKMAVDKSESFVKNDTEERELNSSVKNDTEERELNSSVKNDTEEGEINSVSHLTKNLSLKIEYQWNDSALVLEDQEKFQCVKSCPSPYVEDKHIVNNEMEGICIIPPRTDPVHDNHENDSSGTAKLVVGGVAVFVVVIGVICALWWRSTVIRRQRRRRKSQLLGEIDLQPLTPGSAKPDMSYLKLISEGELRRGIVIGSGAFGTVYKGMWMPPGDNVKIPVAIKVLQEDSHVGMKIELLDEARIMASVRHPCCIRILAVCMTAEMMLITQLMPLGSLLDYVREHLSNIGPATLLNWSRQIAQGMQYLEDMNIVHRDLAARNVLVENSHQVRITDFGLAKMLEHDEQYLSTAGKVPIKWLALESIEHRIFTHKSDVWSYGVTLWELFTYGQRPYENIHAKDICDLLEKGERLQQPSICSIDVYMIMIKCWVVDADSRPSFRELVDIFTRFAQDPGRYLLVEGSEMTLNPAADLMNMFDGIGVAEDEPGQLMSAEEYLNPEDRFVETLNSRKAFHNDYTNTSAAELFSVSPAGAWYNPASQQSSGFEPAVICTTKCVRNAPEFNRTMSLRYAPNPSKGQIPSKNHEGLRGHVTSLDNGGKMAVVVTDEDDYIQPRSSAQPNYIDIIGSGANDKVEYINEHNDENVSTKSEMEYVTKSEVEYVNRQTPPSSPQGNPEYFLPPQLNQQCSIPPLLQLSA